MTRWLLLAAAACGRPAAPGLSPDAAAPRPPAVHPGGRFEGAALGWTLGGEVHLFVADDAFTQTVYARVVRTGRGAGSLPPTLDSAFRTRRLVTLAADRIAGRPQEPGYFDATILHARGAVPASLELVRLHRPGDCSGPGAVTELVYSFPQAALPAAPPSHSTVAALFRSPAYIRAAPSSGGLRLDRDAAGRLAGRVAAAAERLTARRGRATPAPEPLARRLVLDAETATDAADVLPLDSARFAVAVRARFRGPAPGTDTVSVSGVAVTDTGLTRVHWVMRPERTRMTGEGASYVLRGAVIYPRSERPNHLLLLDRIADVEAGQSRLLAVDPATRRVVAASPLALRCR
jgi:hypothetical protein